VLTGAQGYFCAGGDLRQLATRRELSPPEQLRMLDRLHGMINAIRHCSKPVIAAVEGGCAGAGFSLAMACDLLSCIHQQKMGHADSELEGSLESVHHYV